MNYSYFVETQFCWRASAAEKQYALYSQMTQSMMRRSESTDVSEIISVSDWEILSGKIFVKQKCLASGIMYLHLRSYFKNLIIWFICACYKRHETFVSEVPNGDTPIDIKKMVSMGKCSLQCIQHFCPIILNLSETQQSLNEEMDTVVHNSTKFIAIPQNTLWSEFFAPPFQFNFLYHPALPCFLTCDFYFSAFRLVQMLSTESVYMFCPLMTQLKASLGKCCNGACRPGGS